ncbi:hypothetical protein BDR26DRAFT_852918, partial [Obelidium mucronatum]
MPITTLRSSEPTLLSTLKEKDGRSQQEALANLRLDAGRKLLGDNKQEALYQLLLCLDYIPSSLLSYLAEFSPTSYSHRLSILLHTLIPLLASHNITLDPLLSAHKLSPDDLRILPLTSKQSNQDDPVDSSLPIPPFHFLHLDHFSNSINELKVLANLNRVVSLYAAGHADGASEKNDTGENPDALGTAEIWRLVDVYYEGLDLHWMVVLGTWHLYTGQIRVWLRRIFNRMQESAVQKSYNVPNQSVTPVKVVKSSRRIAPTIVDVETFLLALIARNYIECTKERGVKTMAEVLWVSLGKKLWTPTAKMLSFWKSLLQGYSDLNSESMTAKPMDSVQVTKYLRDIRSLSTGIIAHTGIIYSRLALVGAENCRSVAVSVLDSIFFKDGDLADGFVEPIVNWDRLAIPESPHRSKTPVQERSFVNPVKSIATRSRSPSPIRTILPSLHSSKNATSAGTPNSPKRKHGTPTSKLLFRDDSFDRLLALDDNPAVVSARRESPLKIEEPVMHTSHARSDFDLDSCPPTSWLSETAPLTSVTRSEKERLVKIVSGSAMNLVEDLPTKRR